jgi:hypothetical protein
MSPVLERETPIPQHGIRYVNNHGIFAVEDHPGDEHLDIASIYNLGERVDPMSLTNRKRWVDGAGFIRQNPDGTIVLFDKSSNCLPRKSEAESKSADAELVHKITGKSVEVWD